MPIGPWDQVPEFKKDSTGGEIQEAKESSACPDCGYNPGQVIFVLQVSEATLGAGPTDPHAQTRFPREAFIQFSCTCGKSHYRVRPGDPVARPPEDPPKAP